MPLYRFEVLNKGEVIAVQPAVPLRDTKAAWPKIAKIARKISLPGCCIRVRDPSGEIVILIGAAAAQHHAHPNSSISGRKLPFPTPLHPNVSSKRI